jgi:hypothetical protein
LNGLQQLLFHTLLPSSAVIHLPELVAQCRLE